MAKASKSFTLMQELDGIQVRTEPVYYALCMKRLKSISSLPRLIRIFSTIGLARNSATAVGTTQALTIERVTLTPIPRTEAQKFRPKSQSIVLFIDRLKHGGSLEVEIKKGYSDILYLTEQEITYAVLREQLIRQTRDKLRKEGWIAKMTRATNKDLRTQNKIIDSFPRLNKLPNKTSK